MYPLAEAKKGFDEVIYLDSVYEDRIEEIGSANLFVYHNGILKTPKVSGSILKGVTRDSVCKIASDIFKIEVQETDIFLKDLFNADEVFCTGTAVQITPVGQIITIRLFTNTAMEHRANNTKTENFNSDSKWRN